MAQPPVARKGPITDTYHGVKVSEDYRWLEDWSSGEVKEWSEKQNAYARSVLDNLPGVEAIRKRLTELESGASVHYHGMKTLESGGLLAIKNDPSKQQPMLVALKSVSDPGSTRVVVDPNAIDPTGSTTIDWFVPSPDGKLVAVSLSTGGDETGTVRVYEVGSGKARGEADVIPRAHGGTAGGGLAWLGDSSGFYYTRYPRAGERPAEDMNFYVQVYLHRLGEGTANDTYVIGKDFVRIAEIVLEMDPSGRWLLVSVQDGDGGEFEHHLMNPKGKWSKLDSFKDKVVEANFGKGNLFLVSRDGAPRGKILRIALGSDDAVHTAKDGVQIVGQGAGSVSTDFFGNTGVKASESRLYVLYQAGGPNELKVFDFDGKPMGDVPIPAVSAVDEIVTLDGDNVLIESQSFISPPAWYAYDAGKNELTRSKLFQTSPADFSKFEVVREFATSKDGTKVPVNIIRHMGLGMAIENGLRDGSKPRVVNAKDAKAGWELPAPTVLWGYGGYGVNQTPTFSPRRALFLEQGGVFAIANIRGGGEYGAEWHRSGNLTKKQNVFDDFHAAAQLLIDRGYTNRDRLAIMGGSNGGLLMGAVMTQHPDLCKAVVSSVGIYDMLRVELSPNGAFNITEFGTVKDKAQFEAIAAYSPYHHVKDGTRYPAVLMPVGMNDMRVDPMHSRKMIARLQAADPKGMFLMRTSMNAGHGIGSSLNERIELNVDVYGFLFDQLGVEYRAVTK
ncbi:MAG: S9 family peptidase [Phycisphaerales bacterium]|nr:S9 family peptidase [Phycisphaerales bacterium]